MRDAIIESFDELLDCGGEVTVAGMQFYPSQILKNCDPIAYSIAVNEYIDSQIDDLQYEVDRMDPVDDEDEIADFNERMEELRDCYI